MHNVQRNGIHVSRYFYRLFSKTAKKAIQNYRETEYVDYLLFSMGLSIGNNKSIIESLDHFGITAIIIGLAATAGSVLLSIPLYKFLFKRQSDK